MNVVDFPDTDRGGGFYSTTEVVRLLRMSSGMAVRNWVFGSSRVDPVIQRQYSKSRVELGFLDLMEVRFINYFRRHGVSLQALRKIAAEARQELRQKHPFAMSRKFVTDRKRIFLLVGEATKEKQLIELASGGQQTFYDIVENTLAKGVEFDPKSNIANQWSPSPKAHPNILVSPKYAFGHPVVGPKHIPTTRLLEVFRSEGNNFQAAAEWFETEASLVEEAVDFEVLYAVSDAA